MRIANHLVRSGNVFYLSLPIGCVELMLILLSAMSKNGGR